jgi:hypothetical protein
MNCVDVYNKTGKCTFEDCAEYSIPPVFNLFKSQCRYRQTKESTK